MRNASRIIAVLGAAALAGALAVAPAFAETGTKSTDVQLQVTPSTTISITAPTVFTMATPEDLTVSAVSTAAYGSASFTNNGAAVRMTSWTFSDSTGKAKGLSEWYPDATSRSDLGSLSTAYKSWDAGTWTLMVSPNQDLSEYRTSINAMMSNTNGICVSASMDETFVPESFETDWVFEDGTTTPQVANLSFWSRIVRPTYDAELTGFVTQGKITWTFATV